MRVCVLGATGNSGRRIVSAALARGHEVTALVRSANAITPAINLAVHAIDFADAEALRSSIRSHDVVVNAAGHVADGPRFTDLVGRIISATQDALGPGGRFWLFGGAALLDVPGAGCTGIDLPGVPRMYEAHRTNYDAVKLTELDWSMLCPGPMIEAPHGKATPDLVLSVDIWPVPRPAATHVLPRLATSLAFKQMMPRMTIHYEDAATIILDHLERNGRFARRRVGVALPHGEKRHKRAPSSPAS